MRSFFYSFTIIYSAVFFTDNSLLPFEVKTVYIDVFIAFD